MTLRDALQRLDALDGEDALYMRASEQLSLDSEVTVVAFSEDESTTTVPPGMKLLMDVGHAAETMKGLEQLLRHQLGRWPDQQELLERFMTYLKNDA
jgi:hypothetical protein